MNHYLSLILSVFLINMASSCQKPDSTTPRVKEVLALTSQQVAKAKSDNTFTFNLLSEALEDLDHQENAMISPLSVSMALNMTANGAKGETQNEMYNVLNAGEYESSFLNEYYKTLLTKLPSLDPDVNVTIANSIWYKKGFDVLPAFLKTNENFYQATAKALNFDDPVATKVINDWVNKNTNGKIPTIVDKIDQDMRMYLINAIYFKGAWSSPFKKEKTKNLSFHATSDVVQKPFMQNEGSYSVLETDNFQAIEIPYGDTTYSLFAFLPAENSSPKSLLKEIKVAGGLDAYIKDFSPQQTNLSMPKFKFSYENKLNDELTRLGMGIAFTDQADFTGIEKSGRLTISEVKHKTFIEVNEEGTEAAAVTSVGMTVTSMPQYYVVNLNRPFLFFIRENTSGLILFAGQVNNP